MATAQLPDGSTVELPDYASEATLSNLLSVMSGMSAEQQTSFSTLAGVIGAGNVASQITASQSGKQSSHLSNIAYSSNKNVKQSQAWFSQVTRHNKEHKDWMKKWMGGQTPQMLRGLTNMMSGQGGLKNMLDLLPGGMAQMANALIAVTTKFADAQRSLTDVGQGLGAGISTTTAALANLHMGIGDFQNIASRYGTTLDYLNDSTVEIRGQQDALAKGVNKGALRFAQLSDDIQEGMEPWGAFGLKVEEINAYLGEFLDADRKRGVQAETSTSKLAQNFDDLIRETSLYAIDTGRNRKEMIKNQIEALSREDAAGHAMMLREQGQTEAAEQFEKNLALVSNELFARFGTAGDEVKEMLLQAVMQGRGLEATDMGAEFGALFGEAGGVLNDMIKMFTSGNIDPAMFDQLSVAMKNSQNSFDAETYAILQHSNQTMQLMKTLRTEERRTTAEGRNNAAERLKSQKASGDAGEMILRGDRMVYEATTALQSGLMKTVDTIVSSDGFENALAGAVSGINKFTNEITKWGSGEQTFLGMLSNGVTEFINSMWSGIDPSLKSGITTTATVAATGVAAGVGIDAIKNEADRRKALKGIQTTVQGDASLGKDGSVKVAGQDIPKGKTFIKDGVEFKNTNGTVEGIKPTSRGMRALRTGVGVTGKLAGIVGIGVDFLSTQQQVQDIENQYRQQMQGANEEQKKDLVAEKENQINDIWNKMAARMAGGYIGGKYGAMAGAMTPIPGGTLIGGVTGTAIGMIAGEEGFEFIKNYLNDAAANSKDQVESSNTSILQKFDALIERIDRLLDQNWVSTNAQIGIERNTKSTVNPIIPVASIS